MLIKTIDELPVNLSEYTKYFLSTPLSVSIFSLVYDQISLPNVAISAGFAITVETADMRISVIPDNKIFRLNSLNTTLHYGGTMYYSRMFDQVRYLRCELPSPVINLSKKQIMP